MTAFTDAQVFLTLAGLTYRGFHDVLPGEPHDVIVSGALLDGLQTLRPVKGDWHLAWGPVTSRGSREIVDTNAMYVVRHARERHRYVVAVRGTNPISASDWFLGDFWVATTVPWPYAGDGAAISASIALGLGALQGMRARTPAVSASSTAASLIRRAVSALTLAGDAERLGTDATLAAPTARFAAWLDDVAARWRDSAARGDGLKARLAGALAGPRVLPETLRPRPAAAGTANADLLTFLASQAAQGDAPLDVTVTGHSKGAALAQAVALWLREALDAPDERWDAGRGARVSCHVFAGPTPGNATFAERIDRVLGPRHQHVRNRHDIVAHAWQADELREIPGLYGSRTALFEPVVATIVRDVERLDYRHARSGVRMIEGRLDPGRGFALELIHQHLDAYLAALDLHAHGLRALTFFF
jgi:lipase (class 3)